MSVKQINISTLKEKLKANPNLVLIDVREPSELDIDAPIQGAINIPLAELEWNLDKLPKEDEFVVYCQKGGRSLKAVTMLNASGYHSVNLIGGIEAWQALDVL